jgi:hypothetical protein
MVSLLVNPDRLEAFSQLIAAPENRRKSRLEFEDLEKSFLATTGLNYQKEIQPWLGEEIALAVTSLDFDRNFENGAQPGYLLAVAAKDGELAKEFLQLSYSQKAIEGSSDLVFETYKGVNLIYQRSRETSPNNNLNTRAVVGDFVLFANHPKVLKDAINNVQVADLNLKNYPAYQQALNTIREPRIGIIYANLPSIAAWIDNAPLPESPEIQQMLAVTLSLKSRGLVAETALLGGSGEVNRLPALSNPVGALAYVPANSIFTAAGTNLKQFWAQIQTGLEKDSPLQQLLNNAVSRLQEPLGLNLPEEIFSWVQGEYSLALVPDPNGGEPDWIFIAERIADSQVEKARENLDNRAKEEGFSVGNLSLLNTKVTAWTKLTTAAADKIGKGASLARLDAQVRGVHTPVNNYEIFATSIEAMSQALAGRENSLVDSQKFQQAIAALAQENDGYFYIDWHQIEPILRQKFPLIRVVEFAGKPLFNNLRSLTLSSQGSERGIRRATVFFNLGVS